jgi:hypothetical protein
MASVFVLSKDVDKNMYSMDPSTIYNYSRFKMYKLADVNPWGVRAPPTQIEN